MDASGPLAGLVVADCSTVLAGPYCTMLLGDLGADVIKIEPPGGDPTRGWGPPFIGGGRPGDERVAAYFLAANRNKRSVRLDLRGARGGEVLGRLLGRADVLVENFRPGGFERAGFSDEVLFELNPRLIHLSISGFGPSGPDADRPGYDFIVQALSGLMSITGFPDSEGGSPTKVGVAITDLATGMLGAVAILAALTARDRPDRVRPGQGQRIDLSLFESTLAWLTNQAQNALVTGRAPERLGNAHPNIVPYETFATADGEIALAVGSERQWHRFCAAVGLPGLAEDLRFASNADRVRNRGALRPILAGQFRGSPSREWLAALDSADVPSTAVADIPSALSSEQARAREMVATIEHPVLGLLPQIGLPFKLSGTPGALRLPPPLLGEHSAPVLGELGYLEHEIADLRAAGII